MLPIPYLFQQSARQCNSSVNLTLTTPKIWYKLDVGTSSTDQANLNTYGTYSIPSLPELGTLVGYKRLYDFGSSGIHLTQDPSDSSVRITPQYATTNLQNGLRYSIPYLNNTNFGITNLAYSLPNYGTIALTFRSRGNGKKNILYRSNGTNTIGFQLLQPSTGQTYYIAFFNDTVSQKFEPESDFMTIIYSKNSAGTILYKKVNDTEMTAHTSRLIDAGTTPVPSAFTWNMQDSDIAEFVYYETALSATDCDTLMSYMRTKWCN